MSDIPPLNTISAPKPLTKKNRKVIERQILSLLRSHNLNVDGLIIIGLFEGSNFDQTYIDILETDRKSFNLRYTKFKEELHELLFSEGAMHKLEFQVKSWLNFHSSGHASRRPTISWRV